MTGRKVLVLSLIVLGMSLYVFLQNPSYSPEELKKHHQNKVVVICGASSGIGEATTYKFAAAGAKLVISARSADKLARVKEHALSIGAPSVDVIIQDFSKIEDLEYFKTNVLAIHQNIDILVLNHAAIPLGPWTSFEKQQHHTFALRSYQINVLSYIELTRLFLPVLEVSSGQILVTGSMAGSCPYFEAGLYSSTKAALTSFFYSLQQELQAKKSPVSVTVYSFGLIMTKEMGKMITTIADSFGQNIPAIMQGDLQESADVIVSGAVARPRNVDYPRFMVKATRFLANNFPLYDDVFISATGLSYDMTVAAHNKISELSEKLNYQVGNRPSV